MSDCFADIIDFKVHAYPSSAPAIVVLAKQHMKRDAIEDLDTDEGLHHNCVKS